MQSITSSVLFFSAVLGSVAAAGPVVCLDFEDLTPGAVYLIGDTFTTGGINAKVHPHAGDVQANIEVYGRAGVGNEMYPNNVAVEFDATSAGFGAAVRAKFDYHEAGGINVMEVNGSVINFPHFFDFGPLNGTTWATATGPVNINVTSFAVPGAFEGTVEVVGDIQSLRIGGQELFVDNVCFEFEDSGNGDCCEGDANQDGQVNFQDLISVINNWGSQCP